MRQEVGYSAANMTVIVTRFSLSAISLFPLYHPFAPTFLRSGQSSGGVQMYERSALLASLVKEVLGPRDGLREILSSWPGQDHDPRSEYITGVLAPVEAQRDVQDIESEIDEAIEEVSSEEDDDRDAAIVAPSSLSPALDPKSLPRSCGVSFTVASEHPQVSICATWARYKQHPEGWERFPDHYLTGVVDGTCDESWTAEMRGGIALYLRSRNVGGTRWRLSVFMVNQTRISDGNPDTTHYVFQPQIRVVCEGGTELVPVRLSHVEPTASVRPGSLTEEERSLSLLYEARAAYARGHLCGVLWKHIDPQRSHDAIPLPSDPPFLWVDGEVVPEANRVRFRDADVRTEFVPCYPIEAPVMDWREEFNPPPVLDPELLAETWHSAEVRARLEPLVNGYRNWIGKRETEALNLSDSQRNVSQRHLRQCHQAADRMWQAIDILATDEDARLAFCFANKTIAVQARWTRSQGIQWRPFQLAFILLNIPALAQPSGEDRNICDLLWFPTGGGKTEAYLGLTAFTLALRRRRAIQSGARGATGAGLGVLSRYTLRLLTIQQFRRALGIITACEILRVCHLDSPGHPVGWRPAECAFDESFLWGGIRFSTGLWVGGGVTPNNLHTIGPLPLGNGGGLTCYVGALDILQGLSPDYDGPNQSLRQIAGSCRLETEGEPAQVLNCPCCNTILAVPSGGPDSGLSSGQYTFHWLFSGSNVNAPSVAAIRPGTLPICVDDVSLVVGDGQDSRVLSVTFTVTDGGRIRASDVDRWWYNIIARHLGLSASLLAARPARPGYFIVTFQNSHGSQKPCDFQIYCPNPRCVLNQHAWAEQVPLARDTRTEVTAGAMSMGVGVTERAAALPRTADLQWQEIPVWCQRDGSRRVAGRIPIPAMTVDDQIFSHCPSLVIATVDKFARLAYEPRASGLFGNVDHYHARWGYYREGCPPQTGGNLPGAYQPHPPGASRSVSLRIPVTPFAPPDLILQDELHLIEGPLGSLVGLYEAALDILCMSDHGNQRIGPKYVASTATVRQAESQVRSLFSRSFAQFPPPGLSSDDRFFAVEGEVHPLDCVRPGRLYVAVCAPGKGALTPLVRIWSSLLQRAHELWCEHQTVEADKFFTLVGYFNAIRELAGAVSLYRQDIPERIERIAQGHGFGARQLSQDRYVELSGRAYSLDLPSLLDRLKRTAPGGVDTVFATSMFGTGVDVDRLGLMVVNGQPKTTASYIQATGRVGRQEGGLVVSFLRASRPRDLDHYEFFTGYHRALYRYVEPVTVAPFSPRARERALGPLAVILLRHARYLNDIPVPLEWRVQQRLSGSYFAHAGRMGTHRFAPEVVGIPGLLESRAQRQPVGRKPVQNVTAQEVQSELDRWAHIAQLHPAPNTFVYNEPAMIRTPTRHVVLGDAHHRTQGLDEAYRSAPQSLRDVEETTGFRTS